MSATAVDLARPGSRSEVHAGVRAMAAMLPAYLPFALVVGASISTSANPLAAWLATWTIYGGAAHLAVLNVLAQGSGWVAAAVIGLLVNARLLAYAMAMVPEWRAAPLRHRAVAALMLTDAPWALSRNRQHRLHRHFYFGAAGTLFVGWPTMVTVGALAGNWVDAIPVAHLLPALTLGALVMPQLRQRPTATAAAAASVCAVLTTGLPASVSFGTAAAVGVIAGVLAERAR